MPMLHLTELNILSNIWCALIHTLCAENLYTTKLRHKIVKRATYTAGEGFLTSCARFPYNPIARFSGEGISSTIFSRLCVLLPERSALVPLMLPEDTPMALGMEP